MTFPEARLSVGPCEAGYPVFSAFLRMSGSGIKLHREKELVERHHFGYRITEKGEILLSRILQSAPVADA
jgi:hypothetical protein